MVAIVGIHYLSCDVSPECALRCFGHASDKRLVFPFGLLKDFKPLKIAAAWCLAGGVRQVHTLSAPVQLTAIKWSMPGVRCGLVRPSTCVSAAETELLTSHTFFGRRLRALRGKRGRGGCEPRLPGILMLTQSATSDCHIASEAMSLWLDMRGSQ